MAFEQALDKGADGVEFDVQLSKDGVPVVIHDHDLIRTGGVRRKVAHMTVAELSRTDVGSWFGEKFRGTTVPTLEDTLGVVADRCKRIYIELKCGEEDPRRLAEAVCSLIADSPYLDRMIVKSFKLAAVASIRHFLPDVKTAALFEPGILMLVRRKKHLIPLAREFGAHGLSLHYSLASKRLVSLASDAGMPVTIWTADHRSWVRRCRERGVAALITNEPAKQMARRDKLSSRQKP